MMFLQKHYIIIIKIRKYDKKINGISKYNTILKPLD
jgi:hypothetical protein